MRWAGSSPSTAQDKPLFLLQCAMEENCLARAAYEERSTNPYWQSLTRRLLRSTAPTTDGLLLMP